MRIRKCDSTVILSALSVPVIRSSSPLVTTLADKAAGYGMPGVRVDGGDVLAVYQATSEALERARAGEGPTFIEAVTYRCAPHATADDPSTYIDAERVELERQNECFGRYERYLRRLGLLTDEAVEATRTEALEAMRADGSNQAARATFERHRSDLGYGLLLTPYAKEIGKADEGAIAKAVEDSIPQVAPLFWSFRLMVGIGVALLALFAAAFLQLCRGRLVQSPRLLRALLWSIPLPWIAIEAGWFVAEFGRQPWTISDVLPVSVTSPMGEALMKARVGETIRVKAPRGTMEFKIVEIVQ